VNRGSWYRRLVLWIVDNWLEGISFISFILVIYTSFQLIQDYYSRTLGVWILFGGTLLILLLSWIFFCIIETRELLKSIEKNTRGGLVSGNVTENCSQQTEATEEQTKDKPLADDEKYCPNCNKVIKKIAKKCRYCDAWLDNNVEKE